MGERRGIAENRVHKRFPAKERALVSIGTEFDGMLYQSWSEKIGQGYK